MADNTTAVIAYLRALATDIENGSSTIHSAIVLLSHSGTTRPVAILGMSGTVSDAFAMMDYAKIELLTAQAGSTASGPQQSIDNVLPSPWP